MEEVTQQDSHREFHKAAMQFQKEKQTNKKTFKESHTTSGEQSGERPKMCFLILVWFCTYLYFEFGNCCQVLHDQFRKYCTTIKFFN